MNLPLDPGYLYSPTIPPFGPDWAFFLDIDGTLVNIAASPDAVRIDAALRAILRRLARAADGAVALISGRPIADIDRLFKPVRLPVAGQHGFERRNAAGDVCVYGDYAARLHDAAMELGELAAQYPGLAFENKGVTLAMHFRQAPDLGPFVERKMRGLHAALGAPFELLTGKMLLEIKPMGRNKGTVIAEFLDESPFRGRVPVFIGDDVTDEAGFEQVNGRGGYAVKVGAGASLARWRLADAQSVRAWLTAYAVQYT